jgi:AraC-like DNA-binding protein
MAYDLWWSVRITGAIVRENRSVMDPLSDVLALLRPRTYSSGGFDAGGEWSIQFPRYEGVKCYAVVSGECWLVVEDIAEPIRLRKGDCILLPTERSFRVASDLNLASVDVKTLLSLPLNGRIASCNGGGDCFIVGGHFTLSGDHAAILLGILPAIVHLRTERDRAELRWSLDRMNRELRAQRPGGLLVAQHLAHMMLIQAIRLHLESSPQGGVGWLFALADKQLSSAMEAMHGDPARHWTLQMLAERAGMSRTIFAARFKETVGSSVMDYLTRWRMLLAADKLKNSSHPISSIALSLGYESESAFSKAFKRCMGYSPRQYARQSSPASPSSRRVEDARIDRTELSQVEP